MEEQALSFLGTALSQQVPGWMFLTNYRCLFCAFADPVGAVRWQKPMMMIEQVSDTDRLLF